MDVPTAGKMPLARTTERASLIAFAARIEHDVWAKTRRSLRKRKSAPVKPFGQLESRPAVAARVSRRVYLMDSQSHIFDFSLDGRTAVVTPRSCLTEFDFAQIELDGKQVVNWFEKQEAVHLLLDLKNSDYFGSSAVGLFMRLWKCARTKKGKMAVVNCSPHAMELLRLIQAEKLWHIAATREDGLAWLATQ